MKILKHGIRVANYSMVIAKELNFSDLQMSEIYFSGVFHDIGKNYINQDILNKPGILTKEERKEISKHPIYGCGELLKLGYNMDIALNTLYHHECWDGTGYPKGLKNKQIPIGARIMKITDVFDALTMDRPYRKKFTFKQALNIMDKEKSVYDPELYSIFINYLLKIIQNKDFINVSNDGNLYL